MTKSDRIREILHRTADELADVIADELPEPRAPTILNRKGLAEFTGLSPGYVTKLLKEMHEDKAPGVFRDGRTVRVNLELFEKWRNKNE